MDQLDDHAESNDDVEHEANSDDSVRELAEHVMNQRAIVPTEPANVSSEEFARAANNSIDPESGLTLSQLNGPIEQLWEAQAEHILETGTRFAHGMEPGAGVLNLILDAFDAEKVEHHRAVGSLEHRIAQLEEQLRITAGERDEAIMLRDQHFEITQRQAPHIVELTAIRDANAQRIQNLVDANDQQVKRIDALRQENDELRDEINGNGTRYSTTVEELQEVRAQRDIVEAANARLQEERDSIDVARVALLSDLEGHQQTIAALTLDRDSHSAAIATINERLLEEATRRDWCSDFDVFCAAVNANLPANIRLGRPDQRIRVTFEVDVPHGSAERIEGYVDQGLRSNDVPLCSRFRWDIVE